MLHTVLPMRVNSNPVTFDFHLQTPPCSCPFNLTFHTHPLLIERSGDFEHFRLAAADVDYAQLIINGIPVSTIPNYYRDEPVVHRSQMDGIYSVPADFQYGYGYGYGNGYGSAIMRVVFWREPVAPFWITYQT